jgi:glucan phosphoethanolaminetransferase (alkaline phosphatase superfamily)
MKKKNPFPLLIPVFFDNFLFITVVYLYYSGAVAKDLSIANLSQYRFFNSLTIFFLYFLLYHFLFVSYNIVKKFLKSGVVETVFEISAWFFVSVLTIFLFIDCNTFVTMKMHLYSPFMIDNLLKADVFKELNFGMNTILTFAGFFLIVFGFNRLSLYVFKKTGDILFRAGKVLNIFSAVLFMFATVTLIINSKTISESDFDELIPFFTPVHSFLSSGKEVEGDVRELEVYYPHEKFADVKLNKKKDILYILVESLRSDVFNENTMPNLYRFSKDNGCITSRYHHSGELSTIYGVFSYLYGLDIHHYYPFYFSGSRSVPIKILSNNGYKTLGLAASGLKRWSVHSDVIVDQFDLYREFRGKQWRADRQMIDWTKKYVKKIKDETPRFYFFFFNSTHHNYFYPDEFEKHSPVIDVDFNYFRGASLRNRKEEVFNRYLNAVGYIDHLFAELIESFRDKIEKGEMIVVFSGDHGEEFWDHGSLGHGRISNNSRSLTPLMLCLPGIEQKEMFLSSHVDVFPTVIDYLGTYPELKSEKWSNGISLLGEEPRDRYVTLGGFDFPRRSGEVTLINRHGKLFLKKTTATIDSKNYFEIIKRTDMDDNTVNSQEYIEKLDSMMDRFSVDMNKFFK